MNKLLKGANSNGHAAETPRLAYNKYLRMGSLSVLATHDASERDAAALLLGQRSENAFRTACSAINSIEEEKDAEVWQEEREASQPNSHRPRSSFVDVKRRQCHLLEENDIRKVLYNWNRERLPGSLVRVAAFGVDSQSAFSTDSATLEMSRFADFFTDFRIGKSRFRTPSLNTPIIARLSNSDFTKFRGGFFEWRTDEDIFRARNSRAPVGLIHSFFEVKVSGPSGKEQRKRYIKMLMLKPWESPDPYRFQERV